MVKIVYGVAGQGSGHSSRARQMASHLQRRAHVVRLVSYDRGYRNLKDDFDVFETEGLAIKSADNRVSIVRTFTDNLRRLPEGHKKLQELRQSLFREFDPDVIITDFEPMTAYLANHHDLPLITIDNQHRMRYLDYECPPGLLLESQVTKTIIRAMVPRPDVSLVTAFFAGHPVNERTFVFPPILRQEVLDLVPHDGDHVLVYVTGGFESLLRTLQEFSQYQFLVYGYDRDDVDGVLTYKPFSQRGFLDDLAGCQAVIGTAGFTLISESLYLKKPYGALPMHGQFEQQLNAFQLGRLGYGKNMTQATSASVKDFLERLPSYRARLQAYRSGDNTEIQDKLDELLTGDAALARDFHKQRR